MRGPSRIRDSDAALRLLDTAAAHATAGRLAEAARDYALAEQADPEDFRGPLSLATIDLRLGRPDLALPRLRRAAALGPDVFNAQHNLGAAAQALELWDEAASAYERALALRADAIETRRNLAIVLAILGRTGEAEVHHRELAAQPATRLWALTRLALLRPDSIADAERGDMQEAAADPAIDLSTRIGVHFALGQVLERQRRDDEAFAAFAEGNRLKRHSLCERPETSPPRLLRAHADSALRVAETFSRQFIDKRRGLGLSTDAPIFIIGMPRSGSTLVEQVLASHPKVAALGETAALTRLLERGMIGEDRDGLRSLGRRYLEAIRNRGWRGRGRFVDKTLENYLHVGAIALVFPRAVILHTVRDPVDTCLSCFRQLFALGAETLYDLGEIGAEYVAYRKMMDHWRQVLPGRVVDVDYEAMVDNPEDSIRWLVTKACGLDWNDACLRFYETRSPVRTASGAQVREPVFRTSLSRWRRYERHLGALLEALGPYAPTNKEGAGGLSDGVTGRPDRLTP
jgi:tetratricopeptide (TPR) repeat protein